jgi:hypothetical protein
MGMSRKGWTWKAGLAAIAVAGGLRLAFFIVSVNHIPPSTDESISALQAISITAEGRTPLLMTAQPYLFPLDAYLNAPFIRLLPANAFGARFGAFIMGLLSVLFSLAILRRWGALRDVWPGVLLVLFPSVYLLMLQSAYALPGYPSLFLLMPLSLLLIQTAAARPPETSWRLAAASGFAAGLICSVSMLAAPVLAAAGALALMNGNARRAGRMLPALVVGAALGLLPYLLGKWLIPGAYDAVSATFSWKQALERAWEPAILHTLRVAMGIDYCFFADNWGTASVVPGLGKVFPYLWCLLLLTVLTLGLVRFVRRTWVVRWPSLDLGDLFTAMAVGSLLLFGLSRRADSGAFRYLLLLVIAFPFHIAYLYQHARRPARVVLGAAAVALAAINVAHGVGLMQRWTAPRFAAEQAYLFDIEPAVAYLDEKGIDRAYSTYHVAHRINFTTRKRILCAQFFNERFFGWPMPYKDVVDASTNVAWVLPEAFAVPISQFEYDMARNFVTAEKKQCVDLAVFTDFRYQPPHPEYPIPHAALRPTVESYPEAQATLCDGVFETRWRSHKEQAAGMGVNVALPDGAEVTRVTLFFNGYAHDRPRAFTLKADVGDGVWKTVVERVERDYDAFQWRNNHPIMGDAAQTMRFDPTPAQRLRIEILEPERGRDWTIGEIVVYTREPVKR